MYVPVCVLRFFWSYQKSVTVSNFFGVPSNQLNKSSFRKWIKTLQGSKVVSNIVSTNRSICDLFQKGCHLLMMSPIRNCFIVTTRMDHHFKRKEQDLLPDSEMFYRAVKSFLTPMLYCYFWSAWCDRQCGHQWMKNCFKT